MRLLALLAVALVALPAACGGGGSDDRADDGDAGAPTAASPAPLEQASAGCDLVDPHAAGDFDQSLSSGGLDRTYILHVPAGYDGSQPAPLVLVFHGWALNATFMADYTKFAALADREGFIVVTPDGSGNPKHWNSFPEGESPLGEADADDVAFVRDLLARLDAELCIDEARTYSTGYSNGGGMSNLLACELPDRIRAVGLVGSIYLDCPAVPVIAFHGTEDTFVAYDGAGGPGSGETPRTIAERVAAWAQRLGCEVEPSLTNPGTEVQLATYNGCTVGDGLAQLYTISGGGHNWPGAMPIEGLGHNTRQLDATALIWQFFASLPDATSATR